MSAATLVRAVVLTGPEELEVRSLPRPATGPDDGLLLVEANGVCGTDVHFRATGADAPRILGHEVVGRVLEIGDRAAQRWGVQAGDRVAVEAGIVCGVCRECQAGYGQNCTAALGYGSGVPITVGSGLWGGLAELMYLAPGTVLTKVPAGVPPDVAAGWFSPLANAVDWTGPEAGRVQPGDTVAILGPGPQGLAATLAAKARGARTVVVAGLTADEHRLAAARTLGADVTVTVDNQSLAEAIREHNGGELADTVLDASGSVRSAVSTAHLVRRRGTIVGATPLIAPDGVNLPLPLMIWNQIRWQGVLSNRPSLAGPAADLLAANVDVLAPLITHRFGLDDSRTAIDVVANRASDGTPPIKVVVCPQDAAWPAGASRR